MTGLSHNHKRRILTSLQYADKQLDASLHSLAPSSQPLFSGYIQDLSPAQARYVECYAEKIRMQMTRLLEKCDIEVPSPSTSAMGRVRTSLTSLDLTLEDIHPEKLRGYGKIDSAAARDLSLYVRSRKHHGLEGIRRIANATASLPPNMLILPSSWSP